MKSQSTFTPSLHPTAQAPEPIEEGRLRSINPSDGTLLGDVELVTPESIPTLVERAQEAQRAWMRRPLSTRIQRARRLTQDILNWRAELLDLLADETGKSPVEARRELWNACEELADITSKAPESLGESRSSRWSGGQPQTVRWRPRGVVLVLASAYSPLHTALAPMVAALVAGNAVIVVPDDRSPLTAHSLVNVATSAGIPDALVQAVAGGPAVIDALANQADAIVSYGSAVLTRRLSRAQSARFIPLLGRWPTGDVVVVLSDADLEHAARSAVQACCIGSGRGYRSPARIYVQDTVIDPFLDAVVEEVGRLRTPRGSAGTVSAPESTGPVGPLFDSEDLHRLESLVEGAISAGARLVAGGRKRPRSRGYFFEPTILSHVDEEMALWQQCPPGPLITLATFSAPAEAVLRVRSLPGYGQVALFSKSRSVIDDLARRLDAPLVGVNAIFDELPAASDPVATSLQGPTDPVGAHRLQALSHRVVLLENRLDRIHLALRRRSEGQLLRAMDSALALFHRQGLLRRTAEALWPPR